ncbi:unknown [Bacteroides sp. CAG:633]|nr:unknown [Bacteroides sp. CAG:633]
MERCILILWHLFHFAVQFRSRCLINAASISQTRQAHSLQYTQYTCSIYVGCKLRRVETYLHMTLCSEVVYFGRSHFSYDLQDAHRVAQVGIM